MKNYKSFNILTIGLSLAVIATGIFLINGCAPTKAIQEKTGVQLWGENCQRCHNTPSPSTFSPEQWETIGMHMQTRALLTQAEREKIVKFLKVNN